MKYTHKRYLKKDLKFLREIKNAMNDFMADANDIVARESLKNMIDHWLLELERDVVEWN